jgi:hypothetical protein
MEQVGRARVRTTLSKAQRAYETPNQETLRRFLAANEAMGRVGAILADTVVGRSAEDLSDLRRAMSRVMDDLQSLAHSTGVDLEGSQG